MVGARSAAMAFNRIVDARYDKLNPRTSGRALPRGSLVVGVCSGLYSCNVGVVRFFGLAAEFPVLLFVLPNAGNPAFLLVH